MYLINMYIYQIYYNNETFEKLDKDFIPLDNSNNENKDWYEFDVILNFLMKNKLKKNTWYGFLSPEFFNKTNLTGYELKFHLSNSISSNVCLATSCYDQIAIYQNCFLQGENKHPGLISATEYLLKKYKLNLQIRNLVGHSSNTVYSNYLIAKKEYWNEWLKLANFFVKLRKKDENFHNLICSKGNYKNTRVNLGVFIQERFPTIILSSNKFNVTTLLSSDYQFCNKLIPLDFRSKGLVQSCDYFKVKYSKTGNKNLINMLKYNLQEIRLLTENNTNRK